MGIKMSRAVAIAFSGLLLQWAGYKNVDVPVSEQGEHIAFLFGPRGWCLFHSWCNRILIYANVSR